MDALVDNGRTLEFIKDQYRHCKPILALGHSAELRERASVPALLESGEADTDVLIFASDELESGVAAFVEALDAHRHLGREMHPPTI